jgi:hypothetical protein
MLKQALVKYSLENRAWRVFSLLALLSVVSCSGGQDTAELTDGSVPWPPPPGVVRQVDALVPTSIPGDMALSTGGDFVLLEDALLLLTGKPLSYAIYGMAGFSDAVRPQMVEIVGSSIDEEPGIIYLALANYETGRWDFLEPQPTNIAEFPIPADYVQNGRVNIAAVVYGTADYRIDEVIFTADTDAPAPPEGLTAAADMDRVTLQWEPVPQAISYKLYRGFKSTLSDATLLESAITTEEHIDLEVEQGKMYFYGVTTVGEGGESAKSNAAGAWVPEWDYPAPTNLRTIEVTPFTVTVGWDWEGSDPSRFRIFVKDKPNFDLDTPFYLKTDVDGDLRTATFDIVPGVEYWFRVGAMRVQKMGRLSEAVEVDNLGEWRWAPSESLGTGSGPVSAAIVNGEFTVSFIRDTDVMLGRRRSNAWELHETPLNDELDTIDDSVGLPEYGFHNYADFAHNGTEYFIAAFTPGTGSIYGCFGSPEAGWDAKLIAGQRTLVPPNGSLGSYCDVEATTSQFAVLYAEMGEYKADSILAITDDRGENWTNTLVNHNAGSIAFHSLEPHNGQFYAMVLHQQFPLNDIEGPPFEPAQPQELFFYDHTAGTMELLSSTIGYHVGEYNDLKWVNGGWMSPAFNNGDYDLYSFENVSGWEMKKIDGGEGDSRVGIFSRLTVDSDNRAVCAYIDGSQGWWLLARYEDGEWIPYASLLSADEMGQPDLAYIGDDLWIVYPDQFAGEVKCGRVFPPDV